MIGYHGTIADNLPSILENGLSAYSDNKVWNVSENAVYFWGGNFINANGFQDEDPEFITSQLKRAAVDSASCALGAAKDCRIVVVEFEVPDDEVDTDSSCENMEHANCIYRDVTPDEIRNITISEDLSILRGVFIALMIDRPMSNLEFSKTERKISKLMMESNIVDYTFEFLDKCEFTEVTPKA